MTAVLFKFVKPDGAPVVGAPFLVTSRKPSFDEALDNGIILPGDVRGVTDEQGEATLDLVPSIAPYHLQMSLNASVGDSEDCSMGVRYRFLVPSSEAVLRVEDLIVTVPTWSRPWDELALQTIIDAKANAQASAQDARKSAARAEAAREGVEQFAIDAANSASAADGSAIAAKTSETNTAASEARTKVSENNTKASENAASASASAAKDSENKTKSSENAAGISAQDAANAERNASLSAIAAKNSQDASKTSETNSGASAEASANSATAANASKNAAGVSETNAKNSENKAKQWATNPVDSVVDSGQYSALHWAQKARDAANDAGSVTGPRLTSIAQAVLNVNDMLIADSSTTMKGIATGATGRSLLAAASQAAAQALLGLTPQQSVGDTTSGRVLVNGFAFGLGAAGMNITDANSTLYNGFYRLSSPFSNAPTAAAYSIIVTRYDDEIKQLAFREGATTSIMYLRARAGTSSWGPWQRFIVGDSNGILSVASGGTGGTTVAEAQTNLSLVPTVNNMDTTAGRLMRMGDIGLGGTGGTLTTFTSNADWAKPAGYTTFLNVAASKANGVTFPTAKVGGSFDTTFGTYTVLGRRDSQNGYVGLFSDYSNGRTWLTVAAASSSAPAFYEMYSQNNTSTFIQSLLDDADQATAQTTLGLVPTSSSSDSTFGRMLKVGDFGIAGPAISVPNSTLNQVLPSGAYRGGASIVGFPPQIVPASGDLIEIQQWDGTAHYQRYSCIALRRSFWRAVLGSTAADFSASSWNEVINLANPDVVRSRLLISGRNRIINGDMTVYQRASSALTGTNSGYCCDRWKCTNGGAGGTIVPGRDGNVNINGTSRWWARASTQSPLTDLATNKYWGGLQTSFESSYVSDIAKSTTVLSFYFYASETGTYSIALRDSGANFSFVQNFGVQANTPTKVEIVIPPLPFNVSINNLAAMNLMIGSINNGNFVAPSLNQWVSGNYICGNGITQWGLKTNAFIQVTDVQYEIGNAATPYDRRPADEELRRCQRYYEEVLGTVYPGGSPYVYYSYVVQKRGVPSITLVAGSVSGANFDTAGLDKSLRCPAGTQATTASDFKFAVDSEII